MRVLPVSSYDSFSDTYFGWPTVLGREGAVRRLDLKLSEKEGVELQKSINVLKKAIKSISIKPKIVDKALIRLLRNHLQLFQSPL